jgi:hypothetical protein
VARIQVEPIMPDVLPRAEAANWTRVSRVGQEVQLTFGYMDVGLIADAVGKRRDSKESLRLPVDVTHRLVLSAEQFKNFKTKIDEIYAAMEKSGHIPKDAP